MVEKSELWMMLSKAIINENFPLSQLTAEIIGCAMEVHKTLGNGFQEVIYQRALAIEMQTRRIAFAREHEIPTTGASLPALGRCYGETCALSLLAVFRLPKKQCGGAVSVVGTKSKYSRINSLRDQAK
jgi:hypothetical protein